MPSSYTTNLRFELQGTGENKASWGQKANTVFELVEEAICGKLDVTIADADLLLNVLNGVTDQARPMMLNFVGTLTAIRAVTFPSGKSKVYIVRNSTSGAFSITLKVGSSTYLLRNGQQKLIYTDGSSIWSNDTWITQTSASTRWDIPAYIDSNGFIEAGANIDFHNTNIDGDDYSIRLGTNGTTSDLYITPFSPAGPASKIWTAWNDGSGSGLDADLLDGLHAAQIQFPEAPSNGKTHGRKNASWVETPGPYVGFVTGDISLGGAVTGSAGRIAFNTNATFTGSEVASISDIGEIKATTYFTSSSTAAVLSATGAGAVYLRPNGRDATDQQMVVDANGSLIVSGAVYAVQNFQSSSTHIVMGASSGNVYFRPYGADSSTHEGYQATDGGMRSNFYHTLGSGVGTHSFFNGNGPLGAGTSGIYVFGNGSANSQAGYFYTFPGAPVGADSHVHLAFHQPSVAWWAIYAHGPSIGHSWGVHSDARTKSDFKDCDCADAYSKVLAIPIKSYRKIEGGMISLARHAYDEMGFVAQDVETVIPEAVRDIPVPRQGKNGIGIESTETTKVVFDRTLLGTLWAAVQHQAHMIEALQAEMQTMKGKA